MSKKSLIPIVFLSLLTGWSQSQIMSDNAKLLKAVAERGQAEVVTTTGGINDIRNLSRSYSIRSVNGKELSLLLSPLTVRNFISEERVYQLKAEPAIKGEMTAVSMTRAMEWDV